MQNFLLKGLCVSLCTFVAKILTNTPEGHLKSTASGCRLQGYGKKLKEHLNKKGECVRIIGLKVRRFPDAER
jgi:hypothetical protein